MRLKFVTLKTVEVISKHKQKKVKAGNSNVIIAEDLTIV